MENNNKEMGSNFEWFLRKKHHKSYSGHYSEFLLWFDKIKIEDCVKYADEYAQKERQRICEELEKIKSPCDDGCDLDDAFRRAIKEAIQKISDAN